MSNFVINPNKLSKILFRILYGLSFNDAIPDNNLYSFDKVDGRVIEYSGGISSPSYTGNGSESIDIIFS
jgi:hypothetical protein